MVDYSEIVVMVAELIGVCFPVALIFGISGKLFNLAFSMIFNKKIDL